MKKWMMAWALIFVAALSSWAQPNRRVTVTGTVVDGEDKSFVTQATVQLLSLPDSTMAVGNVTNLDGAFSLSARPGNYVLKVSFVGYLSQFKPLRLKAGQSKVQVGTIELSSDAIMLGEAVVVAEAPQVTVSEDTIGYNASAYRTPEGAVLEELVKKLPGAEVDEDGNIKINGKEVKKLMVDGKEFFGGDVKTGLKNLPVNMVEKLKTYDKKSDLARITGIDDGEEETVLDLTVKKGMNQGWIGNADLGAGSKDRYMGRAMVSRFSDHTNISVIGSANNVNDQGFSGGGAPRWRRNNGLNTTKMAGVNFATETEKLEMGGSVRYNYRDADMITKGNSEDFLRNSYSNSNGQNRNKTDDFNADFRLEWKPDSMTNIIFRPNFSYSRGDNRSQSESGTFNQDPFQFVANPNDYLDISEIEGDDPLRDIRVNVTNNHSLTDTKSMSGNATLQVNRKLNDKGRNITFRGRFGYSDSDNDQYRESSTRYFLFSENPDSLLRRNQFIQTPTKNYDYLAQLTYSEPIGRALFLQLSYKFQYKNRQSNKSTFDLNEFPWQVGKPLPQGYETAYVDSLSKDAQYDYFNHDVTLSLRLLREKYQLNAGISLQPQHTKLSYKKGAYMTDTTRSVFNFAPMVDFRYRFSKLSQLRITYRGRSDQPSMEDLLPIVDNSNPLNIRVGNPGLKPSFSHTLRAFYNTYDAKKQQGIMTHLMVTALQNAVSNKTVYDEQTGARTVTPENINGNWNAFGMFGYNTALKNKKYTLNTFTTARYQNQVAYDVDKETKATVRNRATNLVVGERFSGNYRNDWLELSLNGSMEYTWERSKLNPQNNQEPYTFSYGASTNITLPWKMTFSTNLTNQCRRGYSDSSMNRDELIWNAQVAQSFLKGAATVSFEMYDILKEQSSISRSLTANSRSVTEYNSINSYCMLHLIYRLNLFGSKAARGKMMPRGMGFGGGMGFGRGHGRHF